MMLLDEIQKAYPKVMWDLTGVTPKIADRILLVFGRIVQEYPVILTRLEYIGTGRKLYGENIAMSHHWNADTTSTDYTCICLNPEYYGDCPKFKQEMQQSVQAGFHPKGTDSVESSFAHEMGHVLMYALLDDPKLKPTVEAWFKSHHADKSLSTYALENAREAWAEGFAVIESNAPEVAYTVAQQKLLNWVRSTWRSAGPSTPKEIRKNREADMYQRIQSNISQTRKELKGKEKESLTEKQGGNVSSICEQIQSLVDELKQMSAPLEQWDARRGQSSGSGDASGRWCC